MRQPIEIHPDDVDTVAQHMLEVEGAAGGDVPERPWEDFTDEMLEDWRRWARAAGAGASKVACNVGWPALVAARGMAQALAERRVQT